MAVVKQNILVDLTNEEVLMRGAEHIRVLDDLDRKQMDQKAANDEFKRDLKYLNVRAQTLRNAVRDRREWREIECEEQFLPNALEVALVRIDTGEIVRHRSMTEQERQLHIDDMIEKIERETDTNERPPDSHNYPKEGDLHADPDDVEE